MYFLVDPMMFSVLPKCPLKAMTGLSCPVCGLQRGLHALLHGHVVEAVEYNWFLAVALPYAFVLVASSYIMREGSAQGILSRLTGRMAMCCYVVFIVLWFVVRNVFGI